MRRVRACILLFALLVGCERDLTVARDTSSKAGTNDPKYPSTTQTTVNRMSGKQWPPAGFPLVKGDYSLTPNWSIHLPESFARRIEQDSLVLWRPGLTVWMMAWGNDRNDARAERLTRIKESASPKRFAEQQSDANNLTRWSYRLNDKNDDGPVNAVYGYIIGDHGHLQMAVYFDDPADEKSARQLVDVVTERR